MQFLRRCQFSMQQDDEYQHESGNSHWSQGALVEKKLAYDKKSVKVAKSPCGIVSTPTAKTFLQYYSFTNIKLLVWLQNSPTHFKQPHRGKEMACLLLFLSVRD